MVTLMLLELTYVIRHLDFRALFALKRHANREYLTREYYDWVKLEGFYKFRHIFTGQ